MTIEDYNIAKDILTKECTQKQNELAKKYVFANNTVKKGDIISNLYLKIKVEAFTWYYDLADRPGCIYIGPILEKDNTPRKSQEIGKIYETNLK